MKKITNALKAACWKKRTSMLMSLIFNDLGMQKTTVNLGALGGKFFNNNKRIVDKNILN